MVCNFSRHWPWLYNNHKKHKSKKKKGITSVVKIQHEQR